MLFQKMFRVVDRKEKSPFELLESTGTTSSNYRKWSKADLLTTS